MSAATAAILKNAIDHLYRSLIFFLYRSLLTVGFPFLILYILWRGIKDRRYWKNLGERFGSLPFRSTVPGGIWLHAVSVGEIISATGLIRALKQKFPGVSVFVSCSTLSGRELGRQRLQGLAQTVFYAPLDYAWMVRRVLRRLRPSCVIVLETEIWPNLWREAKRFGATLYVINGRISDAALPNYRDFRWFFAPVLTLPLQILAQSDEDVRRFHELGAAQATTNGNLKYDFHPPAAVPEDVRSWAGNHPLFIAASTTPPDEEDAVVAAYRQLPQGTRMILAPRKPERFDEVAAKLEAAGIDYVRRSELDHDASVLLLDSMGELASLFALPAVVFIGGSLVTWGGHNILEPAFFGRPIITGPHMQNFAAIFEDFRKGGALRVVRDADELAATARELLSNPGDLGERAWRLAESKRGATTQAVEAIRLGAPLTHRPCRWFWSALSKLWLTGVRIDRAITTKHRLSKPVVSVGGLAMGGSGKTPFVLWLAKELHQRGIRVGILTRGYHREDRRPAAFRPGEAAPVELTGDEAQLFLRAGTAWVGIGANRYLTARLVEKQVDLFLLDDGFQHWALERDIDIVLIDPIDPHAGGGVFPAGWLREDFSALRRAEFVVQPRKIVLNPPVPGRYSAFCGIGNPASFRSTLEQLGIEIDGWREFPDHHRYQTSDLDGLVPPLLTTEKDAVNLPAGAPEVTTVRVDLEVPDGDAIVNRVCSLVSER